MRSEFRRVHFSGCAFFYAILQGMKHRFAAPWGIMAAAMMLAAGLMGCAGQAPAGTNTLPSAGATSISPAQHVSLIVSAAASLTDAIKEIDALYATVKPNVTVQVNLGSSGALQSQIENGAPVDVFISAAPTQMDNLQNENLILKETRKNLLNNKVVLIVPADSTLGITSFFDLTSDRVRRIAIGDPKFVPAGTYALQAFAELGIAERLQPKEVLGGDARGVLTYVESGNVDAGIVYSTDALTSSRVKVVGSAPADINAKVVYPVAVLAASKNPDAARDYENFLFGAQARASFEKYGFTRLAQ